MKKYYCKGCKYCTPLKHLFQTHLRTKKHKEKCGESKDSTDKYKVDVFICETCNENFFNRTSCWAHRKDCSGKKVINKNNILPDKKASNKTIDKVINNKTIEESEIIRMLIQQMEAKDKEHAQDRKMYQEAQERYEEMMKNMTEIVKENNGITAQSMSMLKRANTYIMEGKPMKKIKKDKALSLIGYDDPTKEISFEEYEKHVKTCISKYKNGCFVSYVGDIITEHYKPTNNTNASIITTDVSRLSFIVLKKVDTDVNSAGKEWINDKSGKRFTAYVLSPLLDVFKDTISHYIKMILEKEHTEKSEKSEKKISTMSKIDKANFLNDCNLLKRDLDNKKFITQILRYVAPSFHFHSFDDSSTEETDSFVSSDTQSIDSVSSITTVNSISLTDPTIPKHRNETLKKLSTNKLKLFKSMSSSSSESSTQKIFSKKKSPLKSSSESSYEILKKKSKIKSKNKK